MTLTHWITDKTFRKRITFPEEKSTSQCLSYSPRSQSNHTDTQVSLRKSGGEWDCCTLKPLNFDPSCSCPRSWRWVQTLVTTKRPRSSQREPQTIGWEFNELDAPFLWECLLAASLTAEKYKWWWSDVFRQKRAFSLFPAWQQQSARGKPALMV